MIPAAGLAVVVAGGLLFVFFGDAHGAAVAADAPHQAIALMTEAAQKAGSVHVVTRIEFQGDTATYVNDTGVDSGRQVITAGSAQVTAMVVGATAYVNANDAAMSTMFQVSTAVSEQFANRWLYFASSSRAYKPIVQTLTLGSLLYQVTPRGSITKLRPSIVHGRSVVGLRGKLPGGISATVYLSTTGAPLPVEEVSRSSGALTTSTFSQWGAPVRVSPPPRAVSGSATGLF